MATEPDRVAAIDCSDACGGQLRHTQPELLERPGDPAAHHDDLAERALLERHTPTPEPAAGMARGPDVDQCDLHRRCLGANDHLCHVDLWRHLGDECLVPDRHHHHVRGRVADPRRRRWQLHRHALWLVDHTDDLICARPWGIVRRLERVADLALGVTVGVIVPAGLVVGVGLPRITVHESWSSLLGPLALIAWIAWGWCMATLGLEVWRRVQAHDLERTTGSTAFERLAISLAAALVTIAPALALDVTVGGANPLPRAPVSASTVPSVAPSASTAHPSPTTTPVAQSSTQHQVQEGECLWSIAEHLYGDGDDWTLLAAANLGHVMNDGRIFTNPALIYPGWSLTAPTLAPPSSASRPATAPHVTPHQPVLAPSSPRAEVPPRTTSARPHAPLHHGNAPTAPPIHAVNNSAVDLIGMLGGGAVLLGLVARKRRRNTTHITPDGLVEPEIRVLSMSASPLTSLAERALALADADGVLREACVLAIGPDGAHLFKGGRARWRAMPADLAGEVAVEDRAPAALVSLGDVGDTSWAMVIPPGSVGCFDGDAEEIVRTSLVLQSSFAWGSLVSATPLDLASSEARHLDDGALVVTSSDALTEPIPGVAIAATSVPGAPVRVELDSIVLVDLGVSIPRLPIDPLVLELADEPEEAPPHSMPKRGSSPVSHEQPSPPSQEVESVAASSPRTVMIRLLTAEPRVDGLAQSFASNRSRRCTEVLAYLALHHPDPITGDRLRTRVLGTSTSDAAAKTLFNVTSAARRSLGDDLDGRPHLPPAGRDGLYRLGPMVTVDVAEFHRLLEMSSAHFGDDERATLERALALIEGEPLATALTGYEWFTAEGHRTRLMSAVEEAALRHITLCLADGDTDAAWATLERVKTTVPYSERLAVAAMEVAAVEGDVCAVTAAFATISSLADDLSPGAGPSEEIERRFSEIVSSLRTSGVPQASLAAMDAAPRSTSPSAPAAL